MKKIIYTLLLGTLSTSVFAAEDDWSGHASLLFGQKSLKSEDWKDSGKNQDSGGLITDFKKESWPVSIAIDLIGASKEKTTSGKHYEGTTAELDLGLRKIWQLSSLPVSPYIGGGIAFVNAEKESSLPTTGYKKLEDDTIGAWAGVGAYWNVSQRFAIGLDLRYTQAEVKLAGEKTNAGGFNAGITSGLSW